MPHVSDSSCKPDETHNPQSEKTRGLIPLLKRVGFLKMEDALADLLHKIAPTVAIGLAVYTYLHTVYPVFNKEAELKKAREDLALLEQRIGSYNVTAISQQEQIKRLISQVDFLQISSNRFEKEREEIRRKNWQLEDQVREILSAKANVETQAISAEMRVMVAEVFRDSLITGLRPNQAKMDVRKRAIEVAEREFGRGSRTKDLTYIAARLLKEFAEKRMQEGETDIGPLFQASIGLILNTELMEIARRELEGKQQ